MPTPKLEGVTLGTQKIWSKNTGRTANGTMVGDIIALKKTISIEFPPLDAKNIELLESVLSNKSLPFFTVSVFDGVTEIISKKVYADAPSYKIYSFAEGIRFYTGYKVELIER